jgi:two-component system response regulator MprA
VHVLVVDDEPAVRDGLARALELEGHEVSVAADGVEGLERVAELAPDVVVLDVMMPALDGLQACRTLRRRGDRTPVLMLTAREAVGDRVSGLEAGADDYLAKPFALEELLARIEALNRRSVGEGEESALVFSDLRLDPVTHEARRGERILELTRTEYLLLELFLRNPRRVLTREVISDRVWRYEFGPPSNSINVYVSYLRKKTEAGGEPRLVHTIRGVGYVLREP